MKKVFLAAVLVVLLAGLALVPASWAQENEENIVVMDEGKLPWELSEWLVNTVCADGQVFLVSYVLGRQAGAAVHAVQVMEERDGKMLPKECDVKKERKKRQRQAPRP